MIIVRLLPPEPFLVGFSTTKVYSGVGADIVMESITPIIPGLVSREGFLVVVAIYRHLFLTKDLKSSR